MKRDSEATDHTRTREPTSRAERDGRVGNRRDDELAEAARQRRAEVLASAELGQDWADTTIGLDAPNGLRAVVTALTRLHDAALRAGEPKTALDCQRQLAHLLGYGRTLTDTTRDAAGRGARKERGGQ
jgi:hypothetical protein